MSDYDIPYWVSIGWVVLCRDSISSIESIEENKEEKRLGGVQIVMDNGEVFVFLTDNPSYQKAVDLFHSGIAYSKRYLRKAKK